MPQINKPQVGRKFLLWAICTVRGRILNVTFDLMSYVSFSSLFISWSPWNKPFNLIKATGYLSRPRGLGYNETTRRMQAWSSGLSFLPSGSFSTPPWLCICVKLRHYIIQLLDLKPLIENHSLLDKIPTVWCHTLEVYYKLASGTFLSCLMASIAWFCFVYVFPCDMVSITWWFCL